MEDPAIAPEPPGEFRIDFEFEFEAPKYFDFSGEAIAQASHGFVVLNRVCVILPF
jgi:hypothetical protein